MTRTSRYCRRRSKTGRFRRPKSERFGIGLVRIRELEEAERVPANKSGLLDSDSDGGAG